MTGDYQSQAVAWRHFKINTQFHEKSLLCWNLKPYEQSQCKEYIWLKYSRQEESALIKLKTMTKINVTANSTSNDYILGRGIPKQQQKYS